jgi:hypothetical protein
VKLLHGVCAVAALSIALDARADLIGAKVDASLDAIQGGWHRHSATVGPGVEFSGSLAGGLVDATLDLSGTAVTLRLVNHSTGSELNPDAVVNLGLRGFELDNVVSAAGPIAKLRLRWSTFPPGTFDHLTVTPGRVVWTAPTLIMPGKGTQWEATWELAP